MKTFVNAQATTAKDFAELSANFTEFVEVFEAKYQTHTVSINSITTNICKFYLATVCEVERSSAFVDEKATVLNVQNYIIHNRDCLLRFMNECSELI